MRNNPEAERIEAEAKSLAIRINERLRTFNPTGRFTDDSYLQGFSLFSQPGLLDASGIREAQELADQMAGPTDTGVAENVNASGKKENDEPYHHDRMPRLR